MQKDQKKGKSERKKVKNFKRKNQTIQTELENKCNRQLNCNSIIDVTQHLPKK